MKTIFKLSFFLIALLSVTYKANAQAQPPFTSFYNITYEIDLKGNTQVTQDISIVNRHKDVIATTYALLVRKLSIYDLTIDSDQNIELEEKKDKEQTDINLTFKNAVIGEGRANEFKIKYKTPDIASKVGEVWNINIPRANLLEDTKEYGVTLLIPKEFGPEIFITPNPLIKEETSTHLKYAFNENTLKTTGISASYGQYQVINFKLEYELSNDSILETERDIALPPDLPNVQQVLFKSIEPAPINIKTDQDNNILANYRIKGNETKNITVIGTARILSRQIKPELGANAKDIPSELRSKYTGANEYWNSEDSEIRKTAAELYNADDSVSKNAERAYRFTVSKLKYDFNILKQDSVTRKGGAMSLMATEGIGCMEYTDLFISIARAMGIPARELDGYAITEENSNTTPLSINLRGGDLLHSWAEFYDPAFGWVPVDPTWGSTSGIDYFSKLDTNHLVFAVKGTNPYFPMPAGSYKRLEGQKQVYVEVANESSTEDFVPKIKIYSSHDFSLLNVLQNKKRYYLKNEGSIMVYYNDTPILPTQFIPISVKNENFNILVEDTLSKEYLLNPEISDEKLDNPILAYGTLALSALVLCTIFYLVVIRLQVLKRLIRLLKNRPQVQDQQPNQH